MNLFTKSLSPSVSVGRIEPEGILKACTTQVRITSVSTSAIAIDCAHRIPAYPCTTYPPATTFFQPLFLYESLSGAVGAVVLLWVARRFPARLLAGDIALLVVTWYSTTRFLLEPLRADNWLLGGIPTASLISGTLAIGSIAILIVRHALHPAGGAVEVVADGTGTVAIPSATDEAPDAAAPPAPSPLPDEVLPGAGIAGIAGIAGPVEASAVGVAIADPPPAPDAI